MAHDSEDETGGPGGANESWLGTPRPDGPNLYGGPRQYGLGKTRARRVIAEPVPEPEPKTERPRPSELQRALRVSSVTVLFILLVGGVIAAVSYTHQFPAVNPTSGLPANCATFTAATAGGLGAVGSSGYVIFSCGGATAAFQDIGGTTYAPAFSLPSGYTDLGFFISSNTPGPGTSCGAALGSTWTMISTGTAVTTFAAGSTYNYCADVGSLPASGLAGFVVSWA